MQLAGMKTVAEQVGMHAAATLQTTPREGLHSRAVIRVGAALVGAAGTEIVWVDGSAGPSQQA